jgi:hypothetical protein
MPDFGCSFPIRFSAGQLHVLRTGLRPILWASHSQLARVGDDPDTCTCSFCGFHNELMALAKSVLGANDQRRFRCRLTIVQIYICQLAVRNVFNPTRILRAVFDPATVAGKGKKLSLKLENLRKRAKRQVQQVHGCGCYNAFSSSWRDYLDCLRQKLSGRLPRCLRHGKRAAPRLATMLVDQLMASVTREFQKTCFQPPAPEALRHSVRLFLRNIRRGRIDLRIQDCIHRSDVVAPDLAAFVKKRLKKANNRPRIKTHLKKGTQYEEAQSA